MSGRSPEVVVIGGTYIDMDIKCGQIPPPGQSVIGSALSYTLTGPGPKPRHEPWVKAFNYDGDTLTEIDALSFVAYDPDDFNYGVKVAGCTVR